MIENASILRAALKCVAHVLAEVADAPRDWRELSVRQHLQLALESIDKEIVGAAGGDHLSIAAARLLYALQCREFQRERRDAARVPGTYKKPSVNFVSAIHSLISPSDRQQR
jgi:hypothetical protein